MLDKKEGCTSTVPELWMKGISCDESVDADSIQTFKKSYDGEESLTDGVPRV